MGRGAGLGSLENLLLVLDLVGELANGLLVLVQVILQAFNLLLAGSSKL